MEPTDGLERRGRHGCHERDPHSVFGGASGTFLIDQAKMVATKVSGTVLKNAGHWLMEEATDQVVPAIVAFLR